MQKIQAAQSQDQDLCMNIKVEKVKSSARKSPSKRKKPAKSSATGKKTDKHVSNLEGIIIQRYLETPALYNGRKFDIRAFMVILCCKPWFVFSCPGYARVSLSNFSTADYGKRSSEK